MEHKERYTSGIGEIILDAKTSELVVIRPKDLFISLSLRKRCVRTGSSYKRNLSRLKVNSVRRFCMEYRTSGRWNEWAILPTT